MIASSLTSLVMLATIIALFALVIWLQIRLSRSTLPWPGLILPGVTLLISLVAVIGILGLIPQEASNISAIAVQAIIVFLIINIPTVVFSCIYVRGRRHIRLAEELDHMRAQDL